MISRVWHGWTNRGPAAAEYERLLRERILPGIHRVPGFRGALLLLRDASEEVEFVTITTFDNLEAVKQFAGADFTRAVIHPDAEKLLTRYDEHSAHYETFAIS